MVPARMTTSSVSHGFRRISVADVHHGTAPRPAVRAGGVSTRHDRPAGREPLRQQAVDHDGEQDQDAEHGVAHELAHLRHPAEALVEQADQRGAEQRADDGAGAAERADAADDRGSDRLELQPAPGRDGDRAEAGEEQEPAETGERAARDERDHRDAPIWQPGLPGGLGVGADGVEHAADPQPAEHELQHHDDGDRDHEHRADLVVADREHGRARQVDEPLRQRVGRDRPGFAEADQPCPVDRQRARA